MEPSVPFTRYVHRVAGIACGLCAVLLLLGCSSKEPPEIQHIKPTLQEGADVASGDLAKIPLGSGEVSPLVVGTLRTRPEITEAAQMVEAGFAGIDEAKAAYYPQLSAGVVSGLTGSTEKGSRFQVSGTQLLYDFGGTSRAVSREVLAAQIKHMRFLEAVDDGLAETVKTYWDLRRYIEQEAIAGKQLATMQELASLSRSLSLEGVNPETNLLEAERRVQSAETILLQARLELANARRRLLSFTGVRKEATETFKIACDGTKNDVSLSPQVQLAVLQQAIAEIDLKGADNARFPVISLEAAASRSISHSSANENGVGLNLKIDTSLFNGGANKSRKEIAVRTAEAAGSALEAARQNANTEYESAIADVKGQQLLISSLETQTKMLDKTRNLYRSQFIDLGMKTLDDVFDIEDEYFSSLRDLAATRMDMEASQVDCVKNAGSLRASLGLSDKFLHGLALSL